jgi:hypothetical protein
MELLKVNDLPENTFNSNKRSPVLFFWAPVFIIFFIGNTSIDWYTNLLSVILTKYTHLLPQSLQNEILENGLTKVVDTINTFVTVPGRASLYLYSVIIISLPLTIKIKKYFIENVNKSILILAGVVFICVLVLVVRIPAAKTIRGMSAISLSPFSQHTNWIYRRIFAFAVPYFLHLNGYLFMLIGYVYSYILICLIIIWLNNNDIKLSWWHYVSLFTSGVVVHYFVWPGPRPEQVVLILALVTVLLPLSRYQRAALVVLMFSTHESAALAVSLPMIFCFYPRKERYLHVFIIILYFTLWLLNFGFDYKLAIEAQAAPAVFNSFRRSLVNTIGGVFFAYKILWVFIICALYYALKENRTVFISKYLIIILFPLFQLPLGQDASRLTSVGYLGILSLVAYSYTRMNKKLFNALMLLNILVPSIEVFIINGFQMNSIGVYSIYKVFW